MDDVTLLPCPFCGEPPTINAGPIDQVSCENTRCPADVVSASCYEFLDDAIAAWNTRAADVPAWQPPPEAEANEAWALIDPNWGEPVPVLETIRETEDEAIEAAITTSARGVNLYSGAAFHCVPSIKGDIEKLRAFGYHVGKVTVALPPAPAQEGEG